MKLRIAFSRPPFGGFFIRGNDVIQSIVIGVDPAVTQGEKSDETGIVVVGKGSEGCLYVLDDLSMKGRPSDWAECVIRAYHQYKARYVVAEVNQGGDLVETVLKNVDPTVRFKSVGATKNKYSRAEPVAMLYEQGKIFHDRPFPELEAQMCSFVYGQSKSPDRVDALVWALTDLMTSQEAERNQRVWSVS